MAINNIFNKTSNSDFSWLGERLLNSSYNPSLIPPGSLATNYIEYYYYLPANLDMSNPEYKVSFAQDVNWPDGKEYDPATHTSQPQQDWNKVKSHIVDSTKILSVQTQWANVVNLNNFNGTVTYAYATSQRNNSGVTYIGADNTAIGGGNYANQYVIFFNDSFYERTDGTAPNTADLSVGTWGGWVAMHELGHVFGLIHTNVQSNDLRRSIMGYPQDYTGRIPITPGMDDIYNLQNGNTIRGITIPAFGSSSLSNGNTSYIFTGSTVTLGNELINIDPGKAVMTLWDGGGQNTIDASALNTRNYINLNDGHFSAIGTDTNSEDELRNDHNVGIALGTIIHNAYGGSGNDYIVGNDESNELKGNGGADILYGGGGVDYIYGGNGADKLIGGEGADFLFGGEGDDIYYVDNGDTIADEDGKGEVIFDGRSLKSTYLSQFSTQKVGNDLIVTALNGPNQGSSITVKNFVNGNLGIFLPENETGQNVVVSPQYFYPDTGGQVELAIQDTTFGSANNDTITNNTLGNDFINTLGGGDIINVGSAKGGASYTIDAGTGDDQINIFVEDTPVGNTANIRFGYGYGIDTVNVNGSTAYQQTTTINFDFFDASSTEISSVEVDTTNELYIGSYIKIRLQNGEGINLIVGNQVVGAAAINLKFADGSTTSLGGFLANSTFGSVYSDVIYGNGAVYGFDGHDSLFGGSASDILDGGAGIDDLGGMEGRDTYIFGVGYGQDNIYEDVYSFGNQGNTLRFKGSLSAADVKVEYINQNYYNMGYGLKFTLISTGEAISVNHYAVIDEVVFDSGATWNQNDILARAGAGQDNYLYSSGYDGAVIQGGTGADFLYGYSTSDIYRFNIGDGADTISEAWGSNTGAIDQIKFGVGITPTNLSAYRDEFNSLVIRIGTNGDQITILGWYNSDDTRVEEIQFYDGTVWTKSDINNLAVTGTADDDVLSGALDLSNVITGKQGNDILRGGYLGDTYVFNLGDGQDTIIEEWAGSVGTIDKIQLGNGINPSDITIKASQSGADLIIYFANSGDQITVKNWYQSDQRIEELVFADGTIWDINTLNSAWVLQNGDDSSNLLVGHNYENDVIYGNGGSDYLLGLSGNDYLNGGSDDDTIEGGEGDDTLVGGQGSDELYGGNGADTYVFNSGDGLDYIYEEGEDGAIDTLEFTGSITLQDLHVVQKEQGDLLLILGGGDQITIRSWFLDEKYQIETFKFPDGTVLNKAELPAALSVNDTLVIHGTELNDELRAVEFGGRNEIYGEAGDDSIYGAYSDDYLDGGSGNDYLLGSFGNNTLVGGLGNDILEGGGGDDVYIFNIGDGIDTIYESTKGSFNDQIEFGSGIVLADLSFEQIDNSLVINVGSNGDQIIIGSWYYNGQIESLKFADGSIVRLLGSNNDDTYTVGTEPVVIFETVDGGIDTIETDITYTLGANLENLNLTGDADINGTGNALDNILTGNAANNVLTGGIGNDTLFGNEGDDTLIGGDGDDYLEGGDGYDSLQGGNGNDYMYGGAGDDYMYGGAGDDYLDGGAGADGMSGGLGNDTFIVDDEGDYLSGETATGGLDTVISSAISYYGMADAAYIETLRLVGDAIEGSGNWGTNLLVGNANNNILGGSDGTEFRESAGNDILQGMEGNDTFNDELDNNLFDGGTGEDIINAGSGHDLVIGGEGNDTITTGTGYDVIMFNKGDGADIVNASVGTDNTLSLGGDFAYNDLSLSKSANDLILKMGASDQITFKGWYDTSANNKSVLNLQVIAESMQGFSLGGSDTLRDNKVETFNFANLVAAFDAAGATANWQLTDARLTAHLSAGSDTAAIGGDIAYQYGITGSLAGVGFLAAQSVLNSGTVGQSAQTLNDSSSWAAETIKLS